MCSIDWTALGTCVGAAATLALAIAAIWAGLIAKSQVKFWDAIERRKASFELMRSYTTPLYIRDYAAGTDILISPMQAYTNLVNVGPSTFSVTPAPSGEPIKLRDAIGEITANYYVLRNYLDEVDDLLQRNILDRDLFLSRQGHVIRIGVSALRRFGAIVAYAQQDEPLLARLDKIALAYEARRAPDNASV